MKDERITNYTIAIKVTENHLKFKCSCTCNHLNCMRQPVASNYKWVGCKWHDLFLMKQGVKCEDELNATKETRWGKVDLMGIIEWGGKNVSWVITILESCCDTHRHFDASEIARFAMPTHIN